MASIRDRLDDAPESLERFLWSARTSVRLRELVNGTSLGGRRDELAGRSVLIATREQFSAALAFIELDGIVRRLIVCTPDLPFEQLHAIVAKAGADAILSDHDPGDDRLKIPLRIAWKRTAGPARDFPIPKESRIHTEWVLLTAGTTGAPKLIVHTLDSLTAPIGNCAGQGAGAVWGTFCDIRRYGGLQIFLRAVLGHGFFVISGASEPIGAYLRRLGARDATHVSGTPSQWRRALMSPDARAIAPRYIRLSGEIADQGILSALGSFYPRARICHAFASTEAGVGFEVDDGLEGFPASTVGARGGVHINVDGGSLRIRSARNAIRYLGEDNASLVDEEGFVDTGDVVERRGDRYYFLGRRSGLPNGWPAVRDVLVKG